MKISFHRLPTRFVLAITLAATVGLAQEINRDVNPALLYWQAFSQTPNLSEEDRGYFFTNEWRNGSLPARFSQIAHQYDSMFTLLRRARQAHQPCAWGIDLSDGPDTLLPGLAKAKQAALVAALRARLFLQQNNQAAARDELLAAFVLGRNICTDRTLISALVQIAIENIVTGFVAEKFHQFSPEILAELVAGMDAAPSRGTVAQCIPTEKLAFQDWFIRKIQQFEIQRHGDQHAILSDVRDMLLRILSNEEGKPLADASDKIIAAAGGSSAGLIAYAQQMEPLYAELESVMKMPYAEFQSQVKPLIEKHKNSPNLLVQHFFPAVDRCRGKEFSAIARIEMVRAAAHLRSSGDQGFNRIPDPFGHGPFQFSRFKLGGVDRGFTVKSQLKWRDEDELLIFADKPGPAFYIDGPRAGQKIP